MTKRVALIKNGTVENIVVFNEMPKKEELGPYDKAVDLELVDDEPRPGWAYTEDGQFIQPEQPEEPEEQPKNKHKILENIRKLDIIKLKETDTGKAIVLLLSAVLDVDESEFIK